MAIAVTAQPGNVPPRVEITVTGLADNTTTISRLDPDGRTRPVRAAEPATATAGTWVGYDYEMPLGVPVSYLATTGSATNLLVGADYESASVPTGVSGYWAATPVIANNGHTGTRSLQTTTNSAVNAQGLIHMPPIGVGVPVGATVRCTAWVKMPAGVGFTVAGRAFRVSADEYISEGGGLVPGTGTGDWQAITTNEWTIAAHADGVYRPGLQILLATPASGVVIQIDDTDVRLAVTPSTTVTVTSTDGWLVHPGVPDLSIRLPELNITQLDPRVRAARSAIHRPLGRGTPIAVSETRASPESGITVLTETVDAKDALIAALAPGQPFLLNLPPAWGWGVTWEYISIGDASEDYVAKGLSVARLFALPYTVVDRPVGALQAQWTWAGVMTNYQTWNDVLAAFPTWTDLQLNSPD